MGVEGHLQRNSLIYAHRGFASSYPENTMVAFEAAALAGADGIELDVQLTRDGVPVIMHDETVDRTTNGQGWLKDFTYEELRLLDAGSWFAKKFKGARILSLEEFLQWLTKTELLLNIELKNGHVQYPHLEKIVLHLLEKYKVKERTILSSFNHYSLVEVRRLDQRIETAILFMEGLYQPWNYAKTVGATGLHCFLPVALPEIIRGALEAGMGIRPFTVNEEEHMYKLMKAGCTAIFTDRPDQAVQIRQKLS